jgi:hypothetical protein
MAPIVRFAHDMSEQSELLKARTRRFALDVIKLIPLFPSQEPGPTIRRQLARSATSMEDGEHFGVNALASRKS